MYLHILRCSGDAIFAAFLRDAPARCNFKRARATTFTQHHTTPLNGIRLWFTIDDKARLRCAIFARFLSGCAWRRAPNKYPTLTMFQFNNYYVRETPLHPISKSFAIFFFSPFIVEEKKKTHFPFVNANCFPFAMLVFCLSSVATGILICIT